MLNNTRNHKNRDRARKLRKEMSISEKVLWERVRKKQTGFSFRRQHPVGNYILDFYCPEATLCVEVDGEQHKQTVERDRQRDEWLLDQRIETMRIPSLDLFDEHHEKTSEWLDKIMAKCEERSGRRHFEGKERGSS